MRRMNIADAHQFAYIVNHEAWYAPAAFPSDEFKPTVMVQSAGNGGGVEWEFAIEGHNLGSEKSPRPAIRVRMFDDAFVAWEQIPEFFTALREQKPNVLDHVREILNELGARDITDRVGPYDGKTPEQMRAERLRGQAAELLREADALDPQNVDA